MLQPIRLTLQRSPYSTLLVFLAHGGAAGCLIIVELALSTKLIVGGAITFSMFFSACEHTLRCSRSSITTLLWTAEGAWQLWTRGGQVISGDLEPTWGPWPSVYVHPYLVVLNFNTGKRLAKPVVLTPDMVTDADAFRRLRIRLCFG
uniref:Toxin CptA n=1 Tax=Candidatus Kentrum sp. LFY TaxID=2126342 RepID=A0A450U737_9GAMM|nr:MAG: hypothetical protein BECKLFY1418B_GA0070995_10077 [Candidatus Kentron sp. LFY]VFJ90632.1 MAG: hypothetical protein BECKLFY1418A_GA0070994_101237 [Candidatus Kentron sp. LFY]VFK22311.1 MAG: hypothetical protein BECKLFY1418C_GA0070996_11154 [Candidatus Kentron sp. LFY]